jgi:hypothetical protein
MFFLMMVARIGRNAGRSRNAATAAGAQPHVSAQERRWIAAADRIHAGLPAKAAPFNGRQKIGGALGMALAFAILGGVLFGLLFFMLHLFHVPV